VPLLRVVPLLQAALLAAAPFGGQHTARRNAWAAMSADAARGRARRDAEAAMGLAELRAHAPVAQAR
jgi:hypothetical protein